MKMPNTRLRSIGFLEIIGGRANLKKMTKFSGFILSLIIYWTFVNYNSNISGTKNKSIQIKTPWSKIKI